MEPVCTACYLTYAAALSGLPCQGPASGIARKAGTLRDRVVTVLRWHPSQPFPEVCIRSHPLVRATVLGSVLSLASAACTRHAPDTAAPSLAPPTTASTAAAVDSAAPSLAPPTTSSTAAAVSCDTLAFRTSGLVRSRLLMLVLASADSGERLPRPEGDSLLALVAAALRLPNEPAPPLYSSPGRLPEDSLERGDSTWVHPSFDALVRVPLTADGPGMPTLLVRTYDAALDSALLQAATQAVNSGTSTLAPVFGGPRSAHDTTRALHLSLTLSTPSDSSIRARNRRRSMRGELLERALGEVQIRHYPHAQVPKALRSSRYPRFPRDLQDAGIEGQVLLQGVIGTDGQLSLPSLRVLRTSHPAFAAAVVAAAPGLRYVPARVAGCPVPMRVQQPFTFALAN